MNPRAYHHCWLALAFVPLLMPGLPASAEDSSPPPPQASGTEQSPALARAKELDKQIAVYFGERQYAKATLLARESLAIRERELGPQHLHVAKNLCDLAVLLGRQRALEEAERLYLRAIQIIEGVLGADHLHIGIVLNELGVLLQAQGRYAEARPVHERALAIREKAHGADHTSVATSLNNLSTVLEAQGFFREAQALQERAISIRERALGPHDPLVAASLSNLASIYESRGAYESALALQDRALAILEEARGPTHPEVATCLSNKAVLLTTQGSYAAARSLNERALEIRMQAYGADHPHVANSLNNLAMLLWTQGAFTEAEPLARRALAIVEGVLPAGHPHIGACIDSLAAILTAKGAYVEARALLERALATKQSALGPNHPLLANTLGNLAMLLEASGRPEEARPLQERAIAIREKALGHVHPATAKSLQNLAGILFSAGAFGEAQPLFERSLANLQAVLGKDHPDVAAAASNLAVLMEALGSLEDARQLHARALGIVEVHLRRQFAGLDARQRLALMRRVRGMLDRWLNLAPRVGLSGYEDLLRFRGLVARSEAAARVLERRGGPKERELLDDLRASRRVLARLANETPPGSRKEALADWQRLYAHTAAECERLTREVTGRSSLLLRTLERLDLKVRDVQRQIGPDSVLLDFLQVGDRYFAWVVTAVGQPRRIDLGTTAIIEDAVSRFTREAASVDEAWTADSARTLADLVLKPLREYLGEHVGTVYVCPDRALAAVPFAALFEHLHTFGRTESPILINLSMAQDLVPRAGDARSGHGALLIGGVDYDQATVIHPTIAAQRSRPAALVDRAPRGGRFDALPGTQQEALALGEQMGDGSTVLLGSDATEAGVRAGVHGRRVLHFATHGFVRGDLRRGLPPAVSGHAWLGAGTERHLARGHDPLLLAGLAMAGANPREGSGGDDGILTALEASHLDLDGVDLVVLSACQSSLGRAEAGEGVIGLVRAFKMAGSKQVLGSLWKVDDEATRELMIKFYELCSMRVDPWNDATVSPGAKPEGGAPSPPGRAERPRAMCAAAALKKAQEYIRTLEREEKDPAASAKAGKTVTKKVRPWEHPYYWAAWVLWGGAV